MSTKKHYFRALTIAGSDSGGGAGIQADLKTFAALGCYGASVITALTAQNTVEVRAIHAVPVDFVAQQMDAVLEDIGADAIKIGMLFSPDLICTVAQNLRKHKVQKIVVDPVMIAQSGDKLLQDDAIEALKTELLPLATLITPNVPEAEVLLGRSIHTLQEARQAAAELTRWGSANVLVKGGHLKTEASDDYLFLGDENDVVVFPGQRLQTRNNHGTGCTLSSAIAAGLAKGLDLLTAVGQGKEYIAGAIQAGSEYQLGHGHGPVHHFFPFY